LLAGTAALRAGAGGLQIATCAQNAVAIAAATPDALVLGLPETSRGGIDPNAIDEVAPYLKQADAVLIGPGLEDEDSIQELVCRVLLKSPPQLPVLIDAGAIKAVRTSRSDLRQKVLTPHAGEMAGLLEMPRTEVEANPAPLCQQAARKHHSVVALKGAKTFICSPEDELAVCREGNVGLAISGSGDVLAGTIAGLLARGTAPFAAVCWGVYLHAKAGDHLARTVGPLGFLARELLGEIPRIMGDLSGQVA
jgi:hydroxyethylthiazole kinase-like uncharacterized protein yjeF